VLGFSRVHLCGPAWELRASSAADVRPDGEDGSGDSVSRGEVEPLSSSAAEAEADAEAMLEERVESLCE